MATDTKPAEQWPRTIKLSHPVEFGKSTIEELTFTRGTLGAMRDIKPGEVPTTGELMRLAAELCGQSLKVISSLDPDDAGEVLAIALGFIARCQSGGSAP